jgi:hypothetical protein
MKRPPRQKHRITPGEAFYVVERLIETRRVTEREVLAIIVQLPDEIAAIQRRLVELGHAGDDGLALRHTSARASRGRQPARSAASPELVESRRIQGAYMGLIRHLRGPVRARIKQIAAEQGRVAAIKAMRSLARHK